MKKILFATTVLAGVVSIASAAYAGGEPPAPRSAAKASAPAKAAPAAAAVDSNSIADAIKNGKAYIQARYRYEHVDQDGFTEEANANTLRTNLGYKTAKYRGLSGVLEFQDVTPVGDEEYQTAQNGKTSFPIVQDNDDTAVNQAYLAYDGIKDTTLIGGRFKHALDNHRFIGDSDWRQNDTTWDGAAVINNSIKDVTALYAYVFGVNTSSGTDLDTAAHLINIKYTGLNQYGLGNLTAFGYLLDVNNALTASSQTIGARWDGSVNLGNSGLAFLYDASYAVQEDHADNPTSYDANYYNIEPGLAYRGFTVKGGWEVLGADGVGGTGFATPLATLNKFNGWADKFLSTPAGGLQDLYGVVSYKVGGTNNTLVDGTTLTVAYHEFKSDDIAGIDDIGQEWDAEIKQTFYNDYTVGVKYANFEDETGNAAVTDATGDTQKFWVTVGVNLQQK